MTKQHLEHITIVGGGLIGLLTANLLAKLNIPITIIEQNDLTAKENSTKRVSAITKASEIILNDLNIWQKIPKSGKTPFEQIHVWMENTNPVLDFHAEQTMQLNLGHIVVNNDLQQALLDTLNNFQHIKLLQPASIQFIEKLTDGYQLTLSDQQIFKTSLLIASDGAFSKIRQHFKIPVISYPADHSAIVATVTTEKNHENIACQRFWQQSILAFLPLAEKNQRSIVWAQPHDLVKELLTLNHEDFCAQLTKASGNELGNILASSERLSFKIQMQHAKIYHDFHMVLVGDAAHTIHPLAGQGLNLGISDAFVLANLLHEFIFARKNISLNNILAEYQQKRFSENALSLQAMCMIKSMFSSRSLLKPLMPIGMKFLNRSAFLKRLLTQKACGF